MLFGFAFLSGMITILSPCILPVLPVVLAGSVGGGKARPFGVVAGFAVSFAVFTLALSALVQALNVPPDAMRFFAVAVLAVFGLVMIVPPLKDRFQLAVARLANRGSGRPAGAPSPGFLSGLAVGLSLGLVWTPCVGPIMASVLSLALTQRVDGGAVLITIAYTLGTSIPMLAIMLGGRGLLRRVPWLQRNTDGIQKVFGVLMIAVAVSLAFGWDRRIQAALLQAFPGYGAGLTAIENVAPVREALSARQAGGRPAAAAAGAGGSKDAPFKGVPSGGNTDGPLSDYGAAPDFTAGGPWFNTAPLSLADLRGKVVLIDFWTYSCVNCIRTLPYLRAWHAAYKDQGLVIIGVHTPEFEFEKKPENVKAALGDLGVTWPVVQDNDYKQWTAYGNEYWPAHYFIDMNGRVRAYHFGEGDYEGSETIIRQLIRERGVAVAGQAALPTETTSAFTQETYLGYERGSGFASVPGIAPDKPARYKPAGVPGNGEWTLDGNWIVAGQYIESVDQGSLELGFDAKNVFLVIVPGSAGAAAKVTLDGAPSADTPDVSAGTLRPAGPKLYQLVGLKEHGRHRLRIDIKGKLQLYAFTFG